MSSESMKEGSQDRPTEQQVAERLAKQARTDGVDLVGPVTIEVPRDSEGTFEPKTANGQDLWVGPSHYLLIAF